jgi:transposase-like protein
LRKVSDHGKMRNDWRNAMKIRKKPHSNEFKFKVALEAIRGDKTIAALCQEYGVVSSQIAKWKKVLLEEGSVVFKNPGSSKASENHEVEKLHATIGRLKVENDFLEQFLRRPR